MLYGVPLVGAKNTPLIEKTKSPDAAVPTICQFTSFPTDTVSVLEVSSNRPVVKAVMETAIFPLPAFILNCRVPVTANVLVVK